MILAHEIAHIIREDLQKEMEHKCWYHMFESYAMASIASWNLSTASAFTSISCSIIAFHLFMLKICRVVEGRADRMALQLMKLAGYDTKQSAEPVLKLTKHDALPGYWRWLDTHGFQVSSEETVPLQECFEARSN